MPLQECQARNTSSEFMDWKVFLEQEDLAVTKQDYYLAQIAAEIRRFLLALCSKDSKVNVEDFLMKFETDQPKEIPSTSGRGGIETGPDAIKDPRWALVNANAKAKWGSRLQGIPGWEYKPAP